MKTLDKYIIFNFLVIWLAALVGLTFLFFSQTLLTEMVDRTYTVQQNLIYYGYQIPQMMVQLMPPSVFLATLLSLSFLNFKRELTAIYAAGFSKKRIVIILSAIVIILCCSTLIVQDRVLPSFYKKARFFYWKDMRKRADFNLEFKKDKVWYRSKDWIYNLRSFDFKKNKIEGMTLYQLDPKFKLIQTIQAKKVEYHSTQWIASDVSIIGQNNSDGFPHTKNLKTMSIQIPETPLDLKELEKESEGLRLKELYYYVQKNKRMGLDNKVAEVDFYSRISLSFISLILCWIAIYFSLNATQARQGGFSKELSLSMMVTLTYWILNALCLSLGKNGMMVPWLSAFLLSFIALFFLTAVVLKR